MNRREALKTFTALALVPSWLARAQAKAIDLSAFCEPDGPWSRFNVATPFVQGEPGNVARYATNCRICVRVPIDWGERLEGSEHKRPPAYALPWWNHDERRGWRPWPKADYLCGEFMQYQRMHAAGIYVDAEYHHLITEKLGEVEFCVTGDAEPILFRFDGGTGVLMPVDRIEAERQIAGGPCA
jgi:hypothetical protein